MSITLKDGQVTVKAPKGIAQERIDGFVASKSDWLAKKLAEYDKKTDLIKPIAGGTHIMLGGAILPIVTTDVYKRVRAENGALYVPTKYAANIEKAVSNWYRRTAQVTLKSLLEKYSAETGLKFASFALTNARGKWGSCDGEGNIRLNWRLVMLEGPLAEYVVIHELSHTVHHDHGAAFWSEVSKHCPNYKARRKRLKDYSILTSLYR